MQLSDVSSLAPNKRQSSSKYVVDHPPYLGCMHANGKLISAIVGGSHRPCRVHRQHNMIVAGWTRAVAVYQLLYRHQVGPRYRLRSWGIRGAVAGVPC